MGTTKTLTTVYIPFNVPFLKQIKTNKNIYKLIKPMYIPFTIPLLKNIKTNTHV